MYHITIERLDDNRKVMDLESDTFACATTGEFEDKQGVMCVSGIGDDYKSALRLLLSIDGLKERILNEDRALAALYLMKDFLVSGQEEVDISQLGSVEDYIKKWIEEKGE